MSEREPNILHASATADRPAKQSDMPNVFAEQQDARPIGVLNAEDNALFRVRQKGRALVMGLVLGGLAILFFAITIVKTSLS